LRLACLQTYHGQQAFCLAIAPTKAPITHPRYRARRLIARLNGSPISSRAWALQERLLPSAVLHVTPVSASWECRTGLYAGDKCLAKFSKDASLTKHLSAYAVPKKLDHFFWRTLVGEYSRRVSTQVEDRLPAISGLVKYYQEILDDDYIAGHFVADLHSSLLWAHEVHEDNVRINDQAPSWSWAHIEAPVAFPPSTSLWIGPGLLEASDKGQTVDCQLFTTHLRLQVLKATLPKTGRLCHKLILRNYL